MRSDKSIIFFLGYLGLGGVEQVLVSYANGLSKLGYDVEFIVSRGGGFLENRLDSSVKIVSLDSPRVRQSFWKLFKYVHSRKPYAIITGGDAVNIMCILSSIGTYTKVIISQHNYYDIEASKQGLWSKFLFPLMRYVYPKADKILAVSDGIGHYLVDAVKIPEKKVEVLYNPVDINDINRRANEYVNTESFGNYILFIGRVSPVKNLSFLLDAFEKTRIDDLNLVIIGDGSEMEALKQKRATMRKCNRVFFTGMKENPLPYLKKCKSLVLCSFSEAFPTVLIEALSLNKPIVSTPTPGAIEILDYKPGTFILQSFQDIDEFAANIEMSVKYNDEKLSGYVSKYDANIVFNRLDSIINHEI